MYKINKSANKIEKLTAEKFTDHGFRERDHLQEWLANEPEALGEELLIIQKEFDGFDDTKERLDLLALDKVGNIVVIENKLDDSGRNVVWQALKYASYCSTLTKAQVIEIYQLYLKKNEPGTDAVEKITEFLGMDDPDEIEVNSGNSQRLMFVAANFRKEVTSTALWLLSNGIQVQCFKATPYSMGDELFLSIDQIIPPPEAKELMISMSAKQAEEKKTATEKRHRHVVRVEFWTLALQKLQASSISLYDNVNPSKEQWLGCGSGISSIGYNIVFGKKFARVELEIHRTNKDENKSIFDKLVKQREKIDQKFGKKLVWNRKDKLKSCKIFYEVEFEGYDKDNWEKIANWMLTHIDKLEKSLREPLAKIKNEMKTS